jgi:hypothetical protein
LDFLNFSFSTNKFYFSFFDLTKHIAAPAAAATAAAITTSTEIMAEE